MTISLWCQELCHVGVQEARAAHILGAVTAASAVVIRAQVSEEPVEFGEATTINREGTMWPKPDTMAEGVSAAEAITEADEECTWPGTSMPVGLIG